MNGQYKNLIKKVRESFINVEEQYHNGWKKLFESFRHKDDEFVCDFLVTHTDDCESFDDNDFLDAVSLGAIFGYEYERNKNVKIIHFIYSDYSWYFVGEFEEVLFDLITEWAKFSNK